MEKIYGERAAVVAVWSLDGVGPQTFRKIAAQLAEKGLCWEDFWRVSQLQLSKISLSEKTLESILKFKKEYTIYSYAEMLSEKNISVLLSTDCEYPPLLTELESHPPVLFCKGSLVDEMLCPVAVVGTRRMTPYGEVVTRSIVTELVSGGATIISGFMYGVDALAHTVAVETGGSTVGVLGYGFDHLFPRSQKQLFDEILTAGGVFLTEFPPHVPPRAGNFPARNRLVAGMSLGVVVTEAAAESGSHITAGIAADEGREVFAVPGPITNPYSEGTKNLLSDGATLITSGWDVLRALQYQNTRVSNEQLQTKHSHSAVVDEQGTVQSTVAQKITALLAARMMSSSDLAAQTGISIQEFLGEATQLELSGVISRCGSLWKKR